MKHLLLFTAIMTVWGCKSQSLPEKIKKTHSSCCGGGNSSAQYKIYEVSDTLYCFFTQDISLSGDLTYAKEELSDKTTYFKYYKKDRCLAVVLNDKLTRRQLQGLLVDLR